MKKVTKIIHIGIYKPHEEIVKRVEEEGLSLAELIRGFINEYGEKKFAKERLYAENKKRELDLKERTVEEQLKWEATTPEEYTIKTLRGRVWNGEAHFIGPNGTQVHYPLNEIKEQTMKNFLIKAHQTYLDHTYQWDTGISLQPPNIKEIDEQLRDWVARTGGEENDQEQYLQK